MYLGAGVSDNCTDFLLFLFGGGGVPVGLHACTSCIVASIKRSNVFSPLPMLQTSHIRATELAYRHSFEEVGPITYRTKSPIR